MDEVFDPITGQPANEISVLLLSNPNLDPEDAREFSGGLVYTPKFIPGLTISIDFWDIERTGVIESSDTQDVVKREAAGTLLPGEIVLRNPDGTISQVHKFYENGGAQTARGVDLGLQYQRQTPFGTFTWLTQATYTDVFLVAITPTSPQVNTRGSDEGNLKWKGQSRLDWAWKGFDLNTTVTYTDGFRETFVARNGRKTIGCSRPGSLMCKVLMIAPSPHRLRTIQWLATQKAPKKATKAASLIDCRAGRHF